MQQILEEMESVKYLTVMVDTSNHKNLKLVPVIVRYFTPEKRVQTKVIEFHNLKGETTHVLMTYIMNVLHKYKLRDKIIVFCGDNCNTNFGAAARRGTNNVFADLKDQHFKNEPAGYRMCCPHFA
jgi:hypothetical protein